MARGNIANLRKGKGAAKKMPPKAAAKKGGKKSGKKKGKMPAGFAAYLAKKKGAKK